MEESEASVGRFDRGKHVEHIEVRSTCHRHSIGSLQGPSWMANLPVEEPDALMCARPDLWEPWVSNHPGPPGPARLRIPANCRRWVLAGETSEDGQNPKLARACPSAVDSRRLKLTEDVHTYCTKNGPKTRRTMKPKQFRGGSFSGGGVSPRRV